MTTKLFPEEYPGLAALASRTHHEPVSVEVLPGDVGRRRYLRLQLTGGKTVLGVVYPPEETDSRLRWNAARAHLRERLRVPLLIADDQQGHQLVEDFGRTDLAGLLAERPQDRAAWLDRAAAGACAFAEMPDPGINPPFDASFFRRELDLAREAVFDLWLNQPLSDEDRAAHDQWADSLAREISAHPHVVCHRDYHGNNLFPAGAEVGAIDFQDLRSGPDSYDLSSLLWERTTLDWMTEELAQAVVGAFVGRRELDPRAFQARFDRVLLQRAWKVCGTFARAVAQGRGDVYRSYLPAEIRLVGHLLGSDGADDLFRRVYDERLAGLC
ncbi:MAG TPA: phosphotransferase [Thermoanaerobaculia bacterium]|nr:phosphotransferase [Thermoanaerobaculia bacterium]